MKNISKAIMHAAAVMSKAVAIKAAGAASWAGLHQPKEPEALKKMKK